MSFDSISTDQLIDWLNGDLENGWNRTALVGAIAQRLAAYQAIIDELIAWGEPLADYSGQCGCCRMGQPRHGDNWEHLPTCPWRMAQQLGGQS